MIPKRMLWRFGWIAILILGSVFAVRRITPTETITDASIASESSAQERLEIVSLLPRDAIPAIDNPQFVSGDDAHAIYHPNELVLGVEIEGDARAYSIPFLSGHEIVNDEVGGVPIAVTW